MSKVVRKALFDTPSPGLVSNESSVSETDEAEPVSVSRSVQEAVLDAQVS